MLAPAFLESINLQSVFRSSQDFVLTLKTGNHHILANQRFIIFFIHALLRHVYNIGQTLVHLKHICISLPWSDDVYFVTANINFG